MISVPDARSEDIPRSLCPNDVRFGADFMARNLAVEQSVEPAASMLLRELDSWAIGPLAGGEARHDSSWLDFSLFGQAIADGSRRHSVQRAFRSGALETIISPVNGRPSSRIRKIAHAAEKANTDRQVKSVEFSGANRL